MSVVKLRPADDADTVLEAAKGVFEDVIELVWDKDGELDFRSTTKTSKAEIYLLVSQIQSNIINGYHDAE